MNWGTDSAEAMANLKNAMETVGSVNNMRNPNAMERLQEISKIAAEIVAAFA